MSINYEKVGWNPSIYFGPTNMNHMDDGIKAACDGVDELKDKAGATDISKIGDGTVTGAVAQNAKDIAAVNSNLTNMLLNLEQILQDITYTPGNERTIIKVDIASLTSKYKMVIPVAVDAPQATYRLHQQRLISLSITAIM